MDKPLKQYTKKELISEYEEQYDLIYGENACYGGSDLRWFECLKSELDRRGISVTLKFHFK